MRAVIPNWSSLAAVVVVCGLVGATTTTSNAAVPVPTAVPADAETAPVSHTGDAADDPALWISPNDPAASLLIGNDKKGALVVYNLDGTIRQQLTTSTSFWGNVDVRQRVQVGSRTLDVVATTNGGLRMYTVEPSSRELSPVTDGTGAVPTGGGEGLCLYDSSLTGVLSAFVITRAGRVRQYEIHDSDGDGLLQGVLRREFQVGSEAEGCVADDEHGALYVAQEDVGLWRYGAEPTAGNARTMVDAVQPSGHLAADVEGVTLVDLAGGGGYVIASAQYVAKANQSYFTVYNRRTNAYVGAFRIEAGVTADGCERTDGITAYAGDLGPAYPSGIFVCQDTNNQLPGTSGNQNFKLVRLEEVVDLNPGSGGSLTGMTAFRGGHPLRCSHGSHCLARATRGR